MDEFRYALGLILVIIMPVVITFWLVIHLGSNIWRTQSPTRAYGFAGIFICIVIGLCFSYRGLLLGDDLGLNWVLFIAGAIIYIASWALWRPVKNHLDFKTFAGIPEVKNEKIPLIKDGPFAIVRHPRYFMVVIGIIGWCLMSNYSGVYVMAITSIFGLIAIVSLEEKDLVVRFGDEYLEYQKSVPQIFPKWAGVKRFIRENF